MPPAAVHGTEVGWMHFSQGKDSRSRPNSATPSTPPPPSSPGSGSSSSGAAFKSFVKGNENHHLPHHPHTTLSSSLASGTGHTAAPTIPTRRSSWFGFSSKFSSSSSSSPSPSSSSSPGHADGHVPTGSPPSPSPESPKQPPGFLISTLRKLSSPGTPGRFGRGSAACATGECKRVVLNRDATRERCKIEELDGGKLRKVAFCVDVEVAPAIEDPEALEARRAEKRRRREQKALEKERDREREVETEMAPEARRPSGSASPAKTTDQDGRREKKERPREDRKDRKERKRGTSEISTARIPGNDNMTPLLESEGAPIGGLHSHNARDDEPITPITPSRRVHSRPTTDPSKIYKQCCQLRETQQLKIVSEQLVKANGAVVLPILNLSGHKFLLADAVALSDFLALVPVKKLIMEDCGLTDEMVRVVLCGLSSVKAPRSKEELSEEKSGNPSLLLFKGKKKFGRGAVENLSFKNNPRVGRDGWRHISLFIHMSHTLKALDLSRITLPRPPQVHAPSHLAHIGKALSQGKTPSSIDITAIFSKSLAERLVGHGLEELALGHCGITSDQLQCILEGITKGGMKRLSLRGNNLTDDGLALVGNWIRSSYGTSNCQGIDLSNNFLKEHVDIISASLHESAPLAALSLAGCNLTPTSLSSLLLALTVLPSFKLLDLSHNPSLFSTQPDALPILRKHLPKLNTLRKLQLAHTSMMPDHAIALCEILPDIPVLAHFDLAGNPLLLPSSSNKPSRHLNSDPSSGGGSLEEGAAIFTALVAAVKVSKTIVRVDTDDPDPASGDVIKALSRRVVAYCLRNMEAGACDDWTLDVPIIASRDGAKIGLDDDDDDDYETGDHDDRKEQENYVVGGTGVVKALGVCLGNRPHLNRRSSSYSSGLPTLQRVDTGGSIGSFGVEEEGSERANEMSKSLLMRARKIKERIQPALKKAAYGQVEEMHHRRLLFLDDTLYRVIRRFEEEYPECRLPLPATTEEPDSPSTASELDAHPSLALGPHEGLLNASLTTEITKPLSRHPSQVSLASRNLENEEGQMHRFGQYIRKGVLRPQTPDGIPGHEADPAHVSRIRRIVDEMAGEEIRQKVAAVGGVEKMIERLSKEGGFYGRVIGGQSSGMTDEELESIIRLEYVLDTPEGPSEGG